MKIPLHIGPLAILPLLASCARMDDGAGASLHAARQKLAESTRPAVLFVGNSFSRDIPPEFSRIAAGHGKPIRTDKSTHDGWTLAQHAGNPDTLEKIQQGNWDVVVLQEQSRMPSRSRLMRSIAMRPALSKLADEVRAAGAIPGLLQTWGYRHGDDKKPGDDFHQMNERLRVGTQEEALHLGLAVLPVGDAWQEVFEKGGADQLFQPDGKHPCAFGIRTTARTVYDRLFSRPAPANPGVPVRKAPHSLTHASANSSPQT